MSTTAKQPIFTGACVAVVTPFNDDGSVNYDKLAELIETQIAAGIDAICVCGTTGESVTMSLQEHNEITKFCIKKVAGRVKVIAGAGSNDTSAALYLSQHAESYGADAVMLVTPYYNKTTQTGLIKHYSYIANGINIPIILYNVPSRTGVSFTAETYKVLSADPKFNGVKEASGSCHLVAHTRHLCGDNFNIWSGNDDEVVPFMSLGAKGVISVAANIIPEVMVKMTHLCLELREDKAAHIQIEYMDLIDALFSEVNPIPIKMAMNLMGMNVGGLRLPLCEMAPDKAKVLRAAMERVGLKTKDIEVSHKDCIGNQSGDILMFS